jgi:hypothetical protein
MNDPNKKRPIDKLVEESYSWLKRKYVFIEKKKVKTWKAIFIIAFFAGLASAFVWGVSEDIFTNSKAADGAVLTLDPVEDLDALLIGKEFSLDIVLNTNGNSVVAAKTVVKYDPAKFELVSWDTVNSSFASGNTCVYQGKACEIIDNNPEQGKITITVAKPSPGVNSDSATVGTLKFKGKVLVENPADDNITFDFSSGSYGDSDVIVDNGEGTDILKQVVNAKAAVYSAICDANGFTYSVWGDCAGGKQTRTVVSQSPAGCTGGDPVLEQICTSPCQTDNSCPACSAFEYSAWGNCLSGKQTRAVISQSPADCVIGSLKPVLEQTCTSPCQADNSCPACSAFEYSAWGSCNDGKQTRTVTNQLPVSCVIGSLKPVLENNCEEEEKVEKEPEKPKIINLPLFLNKKRGDKIWWEVKKPWRIKKYEVNFSGYKETTKKGAFIIPVFAKPGVHIFKITAINKSGAEIMKRILVRVR